MLWVGKKQYERRFRRGKDPGTGGIWVRGVLSHAPWGTVPETLLSASHEPFPLDPYSSAGETGVLFSPAVQIRTMRHREVYASL